jgi:hypothetical protein
MKKKINITIEDVDYDAFKKECIRQGMKISSRINLLIKEDTEFLMGLK